MLPRSKTIQRIVKVDRYAFTCMCASWIFIVCEQFAIHFHLNCPLTFCVNVLGQSNDSTSHVLSLFCHFFCLSRFSLNGVDVDNGFSMYWSALGSLVLPLAFNLYGEVWNVDLNCETPHCVCVCLYAIHRNNHSRYILYAFNIVLYMHSFVIEFAQMISAFSCQLWFSSSFSHPPAPFFSLLLVGALFISMKWIEIQYIYGGCLEDILFCHWILLHKPWQRGDTMFCGMWLFFRLDWFLPVGSGVR